MDCAPSKNPDLNQVGLPRRTRLGSFRSGSSSSSLYRRLLGLSRSRVAVGAGSHIRIARHRYFQPLAQHIFQLVANVLVFLQEYPRILTPLAHALAAEADPRPALFQHALLNAEINQVALARNSFAVDDVEFRLAERRCHFVLHHFRACARPHHFVAFLDRLDAPDVHAHGRIKLQRPPARRRFGIPKHHPNLFPNLVDENQAGPRLRNDPGQFAQRLRHQPRLQSHLRIAHFSFQLRLRNQRGIRINKRRLPAELLRFGDHVQRHGRLAARFRPVNLNHASPRESAHAQRRINRKASAGNYTHGHQYISAAQPHDRTFTMVFFDLRYRRCEQFCFLFCHFTPRWRKVGICICTTESRGSAPGKRSPRFVPFPFSIRTPPPGTLRNVEFTTRFIFALSFLTAASNRLKYVYRWHPCSSSWSWSRVCAACSRPSNAARSNGVRFLSRVRFLPRLRASVSSSSSLSRSKQLRTPFESPRMEHLLKTNEEQSTIWRTKSKHYFSPYVRHPLYLVVPGFPPVCGGPDDLCRAARHLNVVAGL